MTLEQVLERIIRNLILLPLACALPAGLSAQEARPQDKTDSAARSEDSRPFASPLLLEAIRRRMPLSATRAVVAPSGASTISSPLVVTQSGRKTEAEDARQQQPPVPVLTLDEVLVQVEAYHPKVRGADAERRIASAKRMEKQGVFDPIINFDSDFLQYNSTSRRGSLLQARTNGVEAEWQTRSGVKFFVGSRYNFGSRT